MPSHRDYEFNTSEFSWFSRKTTQSEKWLLVVIAILLIPWANKIRDWNYGQKAKMQQARLSSYENRFLLTSQVLWRNSLVRIVRLQLPHTVLGYRRILATDEGLAFRPGRASIPVLAISKNARPILEANSISYIDPQRLPEELVESLELPFHTDSLKNYLLVPDVVTNR